ncbi:hypothetical protein Leryth_009124 [Lithospermum erythrorhizon]|nr:hypothetical protein Leryth_009124 [Lithospermum erythrorhizon]
MKSRDISTMKTRLCFCSSKSDTIDFLKERKLTLSQLVELMNISTVTVIERSRLRLCSVCYFLKRKENVEKAVELFRGDQRDIVWSRIVNSMLLFTALLSMVFLESGMVDDLSFAISKEND